MFTNALHGGSRCNSGVSASFGVHLISTDEGDGGAEKRTGPVGSTVRPRLPSLERQVVEPPSPSPVSFLPSTAVCCAGPTLGVQVNMLLHIA